LGYANLGALLMSIGAAVRLSDEAGHGGAITALMCGEAYAQSSRIAERMGPFPATKLNREPIWS